MDAVDLSSAEKNSCLPNYLIQFLAESSRTRVLHRPNLPDQPKVAEDRNGFLAFGGKATIREPQELIENCRRGGQEL